MYAKARQETLDQYARDEKIYEEHNVPPGDVRYLIHSIQMFEIF